MNKRLLLALYDRSGLGAYMPVDYKGQEGAVEEHMERFAELIIRECADLFVDQKYMILNPHEPFANERVRALKEHDKDTVRKIKQHFGVEK